jgi:hypothetical protein
MTEYELEIESILGQFCYAFGAGAGRLRIDRETIRCLQARYRPYLLRNLERETGRRAWADARHHLLEYLAAMGRYAASLALQGGEMTILPAHFDAAANRFEGAAHRSRKHVIKAGPWCPGSRLPEGAHLLEPEAELQSRRWPDVDLSV